MTRLTAKLRPSVGALLFGALAIAGCLDGDKVEIVLIPTEQVAGGGTPLGIDVVIVDTRNNQDPRDNQIVVEASVGSLDDTVSSLGALVEGNTHILALAMRFGGQLCRLDRAVGRSLPFVHRAGGYEIPVQIGCADQFGTIQEERRPNVPRLAAGLAVDASGSPVLAGGAPTVQVRPEARFGNVNQVVDMIERYDMSTGGFEPAGNLIAGRAFPSVLALENGGVGVFGGRLPGLLGCAQQIEVIIGEASTAAGSLFQPRCEPSSANLFLSNRIVVAGGSLASDMNVGIETFDPTAQVPLVEERLPGQVIRRGTAVIPLASQQSALLVGGVPPHNEPIPPAEFLGFGAVCRGAGSPCNRALDAGRLPDDSAAVEIAGLEQGAAVYVACPNVGGGTVYAAGGLVSTADPMEPTADPMEPTATDFMFCFQDDGSDTTFRLAGRLPEPRSFHKMVSLPGDGGDTARLLIVGGVVGSAPLEMSFQQDANALLVTVNPCQCPVGAAQTREVAAVALPLPFEGVPMFHTVTTLPDQSILTLGGANIQVDGSGAALTATDDVALFFPDL